MAKKRKSLVGWICGDWKSWFHYFKTKDMMYATLNIPIIFKDKNCAQHNPVKVRITIEEIK